MEEATANQCNFKLISHRQLESRQNVPIDACSNKNKDCSQEQKQLSKMVVHLTNFTETSSGMAVS